MIKRLVWLCIGTVVGFASSLWFGRRLRRQVEKVMPERLAKQASQATRRLGDDLRSAAADARIAMREREASLRAEYGPRR